MSAASRSSEWVEWKATSSATACCCRTTSACSALSTPNLSSSIPIPIDKFPSRNVAAFSRRRVQAGADYDRALISPGGGVYSRSAKDIFVSPAVAQWLGARSASLDGDALIRLLLAAPVDLLWMGGIGTYVKASAETNELGRRPSQ